MADLSKIELRRQAQDRVTTNRDGLLPSKRETDAAPRQINADMRAASRGSSAQALMEIFGGIKEAAKDFQGYVNDKHVAQEQLNETKGLQDQAAGTVDPELQKKSRAYAKAVSLGETNKRWYEFDAALTEEINTRLNDPNDPATVEEINDFINQRFSEFATEGGKVKDFGSPEAARMVAEAMQSARPRLMKGAADVIRKQVEERSVSTAAANFSAGLASGDPTMTFEKAFSQVVPGTDLKVAKGALIDAAHSFAMSVIDTDPNKALATIDALLNSKRANGTPSLAPDELDRLRQERRSMAREIEAAEERKERKLHEENADKLLDRFNRVSGTYPTVKEILELRRQNLIDAGFAGSMIASIRADHEMNGSGTVSSGGGGGGGGRRGRGGGDDDDDSPPAAANDLLDAVFSRRLSVGQASAIASQWAAQGRFGTGKARYKRLADLRKNFGVVNSLDREERNALKDDVEGWAADAKQRASRLPTLQRKRAEREIDETAKRITSRVVRRAGQGGTDPRTIMDAGLGAASRVLGRKYNLR